jgi:hypothetical protein
MFKLLKYSEGPLYTTGIRGFAECWPLCRVPFVGHSAKTALSRATLGKVRLSAQSLFTECWTLDTGPHSAKTSLSIECQTLGKGDARQKAVSGRPKADGRQSLPRANGWHSAKSLLCRVPNSGHSAKPSLPSVFSRHSTKYIFIFLFCLPNFLWYVPTLCRPTCIICGQL